MNREDAEALAVRVQKASSQCVEVLPDGDFFVVQVERRTSRNSDIYTLYDEQDWIWLSDRVIEP